MKKLFDKKLIISLSSILVGICITAIFVFSAQDATQSSDLSHSVFDGFLRIFGILKEKLGHETFRSMAHWAEFFALGALVYNAIFQITDKSNVLLAWGISSAYALTDEIHQIFVPGRAFQIYDVAVDFFGAAVGAAATMMLYIILRKKCNINKDNKKDDEKE